MTTQTLTGICAKCLDYAETRVTPGGTELCGTHYAQAMDRAAWPVESRHSCPHCYNAMRDDELICAECQDPAHWIITDADNAAT